MKNRKSFVTNSSSSSFIIEKETTSDYSLINDRELNVFFLDPKSYSIRNKNKVSLFLVGSLGQTEFEWTPKTYSGLFDKLNWCVLMTLYKHFHRFDDDSNWYYSTSPESIDTVELRKQIDKDLKIIEETFLDILSKECARRNISMPIEGLLFIYPLYFIVKYSSEICYPVINSKEIFYAEDLKDSYRLNDMNIDHQSIHSGNYIDPNDTDRLYEFLANPDSYISVDNDNH